MCPIHLHRDTTVYLSSASSMAATLSKPSHLFLTFSFLCHLSTLMASPPSSNEACNKCADLTSHPSCAPEGYIDYLYFFYCISGSHPLLGYASLALWLIVLFYLLANTSANYFCSNLQALSELLNLSPSIAGVTLLSLGNGAPDVFSTVVSFRLGTGNSDVGLNCILGGAFFVSSVVVGATSFYVSSRGVCIDKTSFVRDICFLLLVFSLLILILIVGEITVWGAAFFASLYAVYALLISLTLLGSSGINQHEDIEAPLIGKFSLQRIRIPILGSSVYNSNADPDKLSVYVGSPGDQNSRVHFETTRGYMSCFLYCMSLPLYLPRRLTIPDIRKERWSKPFAVSSAVFAPMLLASLWDSKREKSLVIYIFGAITGLIFGTAASFLTKRESPPERFSLPWLVGGFLMSVVWTYIIAEELVSLLVSLGAILGISPSILGLTVLAWGNSIGDLTANVAVARHGGPDGAQVAFSGCYGGPIFNTLVGLGLSLVLSSWSAYPVPWAIPKDDTLFWTVGFLISGLLWALVILPKRGMRPDRVLGCGLLSIYLCFLCLRFSESLGLFHEW